MADRNLNGAGLILGLLAGLLMMGCTGLPKVTTDEFILEEGVSIDLIASEPMVILPVAMQEDGMGRLWVVEMPGYMRDIDGNDENVPDGRIVILEDSNGDGRVDHRRIFLDSLLNPRALLFVYGGLLYTNGTALNWTTIDEDIPGTTVEVDSVYVIGGNIEHQPNGLLYNLDNWIYSAKSNARYRRVDDAWIKQATTFRGQWGISMDVNGRLLYNHNSIPIAGDHIMPNVFLDNPYLEVKENVNTLLTDDLRIFPIQPTTVNRGYIPGVLDTMGKVINYTSACAPHMYYGQALTEDYIGNAFVCAPEANLIVNYSISNNGLDLKALRKAESQEFLVSRDESFRPVNLYTGLDGGLYIVDMRKGIIQHRAYMSEYLRDKIIDKGLDKINGKGRIYKISATGLETEMPDLSVGFLPGLLQHPNLSVRMYAQKMLVHLNDDELLAQIKRIAFDTSNTRGQIHALWSLEGMNQLDMKFLNSMSVEKTEVAWHVLILIDTINGDLAVVRELLSSLWKDENIRTDHLLAHIAGGEEQWLEEIWVDLATRYKDEPLIAEALVSGIGGREEKYVDLLRKTNNTVATDLIVEVLANRKNEDLKAPELFTETFDDNRTNGLKVFKSYCSACHGMDGKGQSSVAPSLKTSEIVKGPAVEIANTILNGSPSISGDYLIPMPLYINANELLDKDILDLVSYLKSTYTADWSDLDLNQLDSLRSMR